MCDIVSRRQGFSHPISYYRISKAVRLLNKMTGARSNHEKIGFNTQMLVNNAQILASDIGIMLHLITFINLRRIFICLDCHLTF